MKKLLLFTFCFLPLLTKSQPKWAFDGPINAGPTPSGIYIGENRYVDNPDLTDLEGFKRKLDKKGFKLIDYSLEPSDSYSKNKGKIMSVAFTEKNNSKVDYYFKYSPIFPTDERKIITATKNESFYEGTEDNVMGYGIQIGINNQKLPTLICGEIGKNANTYTTTWFNDKEDVLTSKLNFLDRYYYFNQYHCHYYLNINGQYKKVVDWSKIPHQWSYEKDKYISSFSTGLPVIYMDFPQRYREVSEMVLKMFREEMEEIKKTTYLRKTKYFYAIVRYTNYLWSFLNLRSDLTSIYNEYKPTFMQQEEKFTDPNDMMVYIKLVNEIAKSSASGTELANYNLTKQKEYTQLIEKLNSDVAENSKKEAEKKGIVFRHTFQSGKIGEDYIPETYGYYNAGKKFKIGDIEIQEKDIKKYVKEGGYNKEIQGYTAIYQLINQSNNYYVIDLKVSCTVKMTDVQKHSWLSQLLSFSYSEYKKVKSQEKLNQINTFLLSPNKSIKDQVIVGEEKPYDFLIQLTEINQVSEEWVKGLEKALNGDDLLNCRAYLSDKLALSWSKEIKNNLQRIEKNIENQLKANRISNIEHQLIVANESIYDPDFENEVNIIFKNKNYEELIITYKIHNNNYECYLKGQEEKSIKLQIKNVKRQDLKITITQVQ